MPARSRQTGIKRLVDDVQGVAESVVELGPGHQVEVSDGSRVEVGLGNGDHIVTIDNGVLAETVFRANFYFRWDSSNGASDRRTGDLVE